MRDTEPTLRPRAVLERDAALSRVSRTRGWVIAGTVALSAGLAVVISAIAPGRSLGAKRAAAPASAAMGQTAVKGGTAAAPQMPPLAKPASLGLAGPSAPPSSASAPPSDPAQSQSQSQAAPAPAPAPAAQPPVVSGGS
jgi:hypothetical protein